MTLFDVLRHRGQKSFDSEPRFPLWVVLQYRLWWKQRVPGETPRQAVWRLLDEYDPAVHGEARYTPPDPDDDLL